MSFSPTRRGTYEESSLDQYLKEISAYPLLKREDEIELAKKIRDGCEESLDKLVRSNLRFSLRCEEVSEPGRRPRRSHQRGQPRFDQGRA